MATQDKKKSKRPTAEKRVLQNEKIRLKNKIFKSQVRTAVRVLEEAIQKKEKEPSQTALNEIFSLMDKGVKRAVFKIGKAQRVKSRFTSKVNAL